MKTKLVLWGTNAQDERVLIAMQLRAKENKVDLWAFPEAVATDEFAQQLMDEWRNDKEVPFPDSYTHTEQELTISESLLPEDIKVERGDIIQRAQTEWHFVVLSTKLSEVYHHELEELQQKVGQLSNFDSQMWSSLKEFWGKVQEQVRDRNLLKNHADDLRDKTNELFSKMKELRSKMDQEFRKLSEEHSNKFFEILDRIDHEIKEGNKLSSLFEELKDLQRKFRDTKFTREQRSKVWERLDGAFKAVKEKRFGKSAAQDSSPLQRLIRRYDGLIAAIGKMEKSIKRDKDDLEFQNKKIESTHGQLEAQIRQAKILMIEERIRSKEDKLKEMHQTKGELEKRIKIQKEKEAKREEKKQLEQAKAEAKEKIAEEIKKAEEARKDEEGKLEKAAEALTKPEKKEDSAESPDDTTDQDKKEEATKAPEQPANDANKKASTDSSEKKEEQKKEQEESMFDAISSTMGEALEDVMDTAKAVAKVVGEKMSEAAEELKEDFQEVAEDVKEEVQEFFEGDDDDKKKKKEKEKASEKKKEEEE